MTIYTYRNLEHNGRLGNMLFQIAATIGKASRDSRGKAVIKPTWEYRPYFNLPSHFYGKESQLSVDGGTEYFQELEHFDHIEDEVRAWFQPSDESLEIIHDSPLYREFWDTVPVYPSCSIHVRRGDYLKTPDHFPIPSKEYYQRAIDLVREDEPGTKFIVFSDDIEWCKSNFDQENVQYITGTPRPVEVADRKRDGAPMDQYDLFLQMECDRHIIANSTFSWWGAYLAYDNETVYPSRWFGHHPAVRDIPWRKMIPEKWIEVEA